jgi:hypothetical protein
LLFKTHYYKARAKLHRRVFTVGRLRAGNVGRVVGISDVALRYRFAQSLEHQSFDRAQLQKPVMKAISPHGQQTRANYSTRRIDGRYGAAEPRLGSWFGALRPVRHEYGAVVS